MNKQDEPKPHGIDYHQSRADDLLVSQCATCVHKQVQGDVCEAYPDGIPKEILLNDVMHDKPYFGDNGLQYTKD